MKKARLFFVNAAVLSVVSLIIQSVSISFNVYLTNRIGAEGIGLYHLVLSVYGFAVTLASSGISLTATRIISEELACKRNTSVRSCVNICLKYGLFFGIVSFSLLYFNAELIGSKLLGDSRTVGCVKVLSVSMPFISMSSVFYGYFTAVRRVIKSASAQIFEQAVKIIITVMLLNALIDKGIEYACLAMFFGGVTGEIFSFLYIFALFVRDKKRYTCSVHDKSGIVKKMFEISLPIALSAYLRSALNTIRQVIVPKGLMLSGISYKAALTGYGIINGMVMPIISFPMSFLYSCSNMLIPELAEYSARGNRQQIKRIVKKALRATAFFATAVFLLTFIFSDSLGRLIYRSDTAGSYIKQLAPIILTMYIDGVTDGMLKGLNQQVCSMKYNIIDSFTNIIILTITLPKWGLGGYIFAIYFSELLNTWLSVRRLIKVAFGDN